MIINKRTRTISALGVIEIFTWGTTYYLLAVLAGPIAADTGWNSGAITAGVSLGLLVSGLAATYVGRMIQDHGGRPVFIIGVALVAGGLGLLGLAPSLPVYFAAWVVLGMGMGATLYDAAFSALGRIYGHDARAAITTLTLWGGFASTICWPITAFLVETMGWRGACFTYMALHLFATLPMCWFLLPRGAPEPTSLKPTKIDHQTERAFTPSPSVFKDPRFWCFAAAAAILAILASILSIHLITILTSQGYALATAVGVGALIGPAQVGARLMEMLGRGRHHPIWTMIAAVTLVAAGFFALALNMPAGAALMAYGAGNGLWSITRGALPLALFGPEDYPRIMGKIAAPTLIAAAAAPMLGVVLIENLGARAALMFLTVAALAPCLAALFLWWSLKQGHQGMVKKSESA